MNHNENNSAVVFGTKITKNVARSNWIYFSIPIDEEQMEVTTFYDYSSRKFVNRAFDNWIWLQFVRLVRAVVSISRRILLPDKKFLKFR